MDFETGSNEIEDESIPSPTHRRSLSRSARLTIVRDGLPLLDLRSSVSRIVSEGRPEDELDTRPETEGRGGTTLIAIAIHRLGFFPTFEPLFNAVQLPSGSLQLDSGPLSSVRNPCASF